MIQTLIMILIVAVAVWYLYRRFRATFKAENGSCGCGGCSGCPAGPIDINLKSDSDAKEFRFFSKSLTLKISKIKKH